MENRWLVLKKKKFEILSHFKIRHSDKALEKFESLVDSGNIAEIVKWVRGTDKTLGLKYFKDYFEAQIKESNVSEY